MTAYLVVIVTPRNEKLIKTTMRKLSRGFLGALSRCLSVQGSPANANSEIVEITLASVSLPFEN